MEEDSFEEAVGFEMNNLKNFPFSRFPIGVQLEVIDELIVEGKLELFNVNSGFRGYFARNGPFGRHVEEIRTFLEVNLNEHRNIPSHCQVSKKYRLRLPSNLSYNQIKLLLQKIRSCEKFYIERSNPIWSIERFMKLPLSDEEAKSYLVDCFRSLSMVSELWAPDVEFPIFRNLLTALQFEVTDWARLYFAEKDFSECAEFLKSYLEKQLKNCKKDRIFHWGEAEKVLEEIPGFQLEEDPNKAQEILNVFKDDEKVGFDDSWFSEIKCYRRKMGEDEQGLVLTAKYADYDDSD